MGNFVLEPTKLVFSKGEKFNNLVIEGLASEHMNYHLKKLVELDYVEKKGTLYCLTDEGKNYSNLLDDDVNVVEKQPKSSILLNAVRMREGTKEVEHLLNKRLRQPYLGKVGRLTGKIKFGETLLQAAQRELYEETGLQAKNFTLQRIYHKMRYTENGVFVQDTLFYVFFVTDFSGTFIERTQFQENMWWTQKELQNQDGLNTYKTLKLDNRLKPQKLTFEESVALVDGY